MDRRKRDEFGGYPSALANADALAEHTTVKHKDGTYVDGDVYTNGIESAFSLLKRGIVERGVVLAQSICKPI